MSPIKLSTVLALLVLFMLMNAAFGSRRYSHQNRHLQKRRKAQSVRLQRSEAENEDSQDEEAAQSAATETFLNWANWPNEYQNCNPVENPYLSPIAISTLNTIKVRDYQTLIVNSGEPKKDIYALSTYYNLDKVNVEAINIRLRSDDYIRDGTYITGLESPHTRFFDSAVILFTTDAVVKARNGRRLHTLDGKEFRMEIMLNFKTTTDSEHTQIHVLVEVQARDNPVWQPITEVILEQAMAIVNDKCFNSQSRKTVLETYEQALNEYNAALLEQRTDTANTTGSEGTYKEIFEELSGLYQLVNNSDSKSLNKLGEEINATRKKGEECRQNLNGLSESIQNQSKLISDIQEEIANLTANNESDEALEKELVEEQDKLKAMKKEDMDASNCSLKYSHEAEEKDSELKAKLKILVDHGIGEAVHFRFSSVQDVLDKMKAAEEKMEKFNEVKDAYETANSEWEENAVVQTQRAVLLHTPFQISWLLPRFGGHYFYNGSSPLPPCKEKTHVVVLENSITISERQLSMLQQIPSYFQNDSSHWETLCDPSKYGDNGELYEQALIAMNKITDQVPLMAKSGYRSVWYNPRNLQFKRDDGVHMKSSLRKRIKFGSQEQNNTASREVVDIVLILVPFLWLYQF